MKAASPIDPLRRAVRLQELRQAFARAQTALDVGAVLVGMGKDVLGAAAAAAYALREDGQLHCIGLSNTAPSVARDLRVLPVDTPLPLADAVRLARPLWLEDRAQLLERFPHLQASATSAAVLEAVIAFPLAISGSVLGGVAYSFATPHPSTDEEARVVTAVVRDATLALARCTGARAGDDGATAELLAGVCEVDALVRRATDAIRMARGLVSMVSEIAGGAVLLDAARNASVAAHSAADVAHTLSTLSRDGTTDPALLRSCMAALRVVTQQCSDTAVAMARALADLAEDGDRGAPARPDH